MFCVSVDEAGDVIIWGVGTGLPMQIRTIQTGKPLVTATFSEDSGLIAVACKVLSLPIPHPTTTTETSESSQIRDPGVIQYSFQNEPLVVAYEAASGIIQVSYFHFVTVTRT